MKTIKLTLIALCIATTLMACSKPEVAKVQEESVKPLQLVSQDLLTLSESTLSRGPVISGSSAACGESRAKCRSVRHCHAGIKR